MRNLRTLMVVAFAVTAVAVFAAARRSTGVRGSLPVVEVTAEKPTLEMPEVVVVAVRPAATLAQ